MIVIDFLQTIFRRKQEALDVQDLEGVMRIHWKINNITLYSGFYTRIDRVFLLWGFITAIIFFTAQFLSIDWVTQTFIWSVLTLIGTLGTVKLSWYWVTVEQLRWVVYCWVLLMLGGVLLTNVAIFGAGWSFLLMYLCHLWLGLSGVGYLCTSWGLRSRAFFLGGALHLLAIALLPYLPQAQYLTIGIITSGVLFLLAEVQWDMQSTSNYQLLTEEQRHFNQRQGQLRQIELQQSAISYKR